MTKLNEFLSLLLRQTSDFLGIIQVYQDMLFLGLALSLLGLYLLFLLHVLLWTWRDLEISPHSYVSMVFLLGTPCLSFLGFGRGLRGTFPLEDFSPWSFYRYALYVLIFLSLLFFSLAKYWGYFPWMAGDMKMPSPRKEFTSLVFSFGAFFKDPLVRIVELLYDAKGWRNHAYEFIYMSLDLIFSRLIPLTQVSLFLLGVFVWKDIQYSLLFLPFSFLSWVYGLIHHSLVSLVEANLWGIQEILEVSPPPEDEGKEWVGGGGMIFRITDQGKEEGYGPGNLDAMAQAYYSICNHRNLERKLNPPWMGHFPLFLLSLRLLAWIGLCYHLLPLDDYDSSVHMTLPLWGLWRGGTKMASNLPLRGGKAGREIVDRTTLAHNKVWVLKRISPDKDMSIALSKTSLAADGKHDLLAVDGQAQPGAQSPKPKLRRRNAAEISSSRGWHDQRARSR